MYINFHDEKIRKYPLTVHALTLPGRLTISTLLRIPQTALTKDMEFREIIIFEVVTS